MRLLLVLLFLPVFSFSQNYILKNVTVIPVNKEISFKNCNVFIRNGVIEKIDAYTPKKTTIKGYKVIDCTNKYLVPGLADMHAHLPGKDDPIRLQAYLKLNLAAGVTTLRSMRGKAAELAIKDSVQKGTKKNAPRIYVSYVFPYKDTLLTADSIDKIVSVAKAKHYDFIKYLGGINEININYLAESCKRYEMPLAGHAYKNSIEKSMAAGFSSVEHYQPLFAAYTKDSLNFKKTLADMKLKNVAFCPTLSFYYIYANSYSEKGLSGRNGMDHVTSKVKEAWLKEYNENTEHAKNQLKEEFETKHVTLYAQQLSTFNHVLKSASDAGVLILLSPDDSPFNVPGFSMYEEMKLYKNAGLSNYQVLKCATYNAAVYFKQQKLSGSVEVGKKADLLLLNADPLENIDNIKQVEGTFIGGRYYTQEELLK